MFLQTGLKFIVVIPTLFMTVVHFVNVRYGHVYDINYNILISNAGTTPRNVSSDRYAYADLDIFEGTVASNV